MFGRKALRERRPSIEEPKRPATPPQGQIFNKELFEGEMGEFLRKHGYSPDDPRNQAPNVQPVSVLARRGPGRDAQRRPKRSTAVSDFPIVPVHLAAGQPVAERSSGPGFGSIWTCRRTGPGTRSSCLVTSAARRRSAFRSHRPTDDDPMQYRHRPSDPVLHPRSICRAIARRTSKRRSCCCATCARTFRRLFPPDTADFSDRVREARAHVRVYAFLHATNSKQDQRRKRSSRAMRRSSASRRCSYR